MNAKRKIVDINTGEVCEPLKRPILRNQMNFDYRETLGWTTKQPHMTVPDMSLSIREILEKHTRGISVGGQLEAIYQGDVGNGINPFTLDLVDIQRLKLLNAEEVKNLQARAIKELEERKAVEAADRLRLQNEAAEAIIKRLKEEQAGK